MNSCASKKNSASRAFTGFKRQKALSQLILRHYPDVEVIAGVATAGIPQGVLVAEELNLPFIYVRPKPKEHGMQNCIEGKLDKDQKVVLVEDLISTAGSSIKAAKNIENEGGIALGIVAIFTYEFPIASEASKLERVPYYCLSNYSTLIDLALEQKLIEASQVEELKSWRENPAEWNITTV